MGLGMIAGRTNLRSIFAFVHVTTITALPFNYLVLFKYLTLLYVLEKCSITFFVL